MTEDDSLGVNISDASEASNVTRGYHYDEVSNKVFIYIPYDVYEFGIISGRTSSRLSLLRRKSTACDDIGNELKGYFEVTSASTFAQPVEDSTLDIPYKIGMVNRISEVKGYDGETTIAYWGDFLKEIEYYIVDGHKNIVTDVFSASTYSGDNITAINAAISQRCEDIDSEKIYPDDRLMARFTYYIGAILDFDADKEEYKLFSESKSAPASLNGVMYVDICEMVKTPTKYYIHSELSYNIYYYEMVHEIEPTVYETEIVELPMSNFKVVINTSHNLDWVQDDDEISFSRFNGLDYSPLIREDYKLGSSSLESISDNIYIERQILKPHEHNLQLLDIHTMDALVKYGNGKIKIISN